VKLRMCRARRCGTGSTHAWRPHLREGDDRLREASRHEKAEAKRDEEEPQARKHEGGAALAAIQRRLLCQPLLA
jgi:hypothetical protein